MLMAAVCLHDKEEIAAFLRRNTFLHLYEIGDLDDFFWQYTTWYSFTEQQKVSQVERIATYEEFSLQLKGIR
jgi:hypothetical protein